MINDSKIGYNRRIEIIDKKIAKLDAKVVKGGNKNV